MTQADKDTVRAAEYVLGILSPEERFACSCQMQNDPALRAKTTFWAEHFSRMAAQVPPVEPPDGVFSNISEGLFGANTGTTAKQFTRRVAGTVLAAACIWVLLSPLFVRDNPRENDLWATLTTDDERVLAMAAYDPDTSRLYVQRVLGAAAQSGIYQIWLIADGGAPVSLGVLPDSEQIKYRVARRDRDLMWRSVIAVSHEVEGANARIAPKGPVVAIDALATR